ncbi:hypothetical protein ACFL0E_00630 [Nanoarchaeota archaeon]
MNNKAQFELRKSLYWMVIGIVVTIVVFVFAFILASHQNRLTKIPSELKSELLSLRFVNNPDCFTYQDSVTKRVFPGIIDLTKFTDDDLLNCYKTETKEENKDYNFRLKLKVQNKEIKTNNYRNVNTYVLTKEVLVKIGEDLKKDTLEIFVQEKVGK